MKPFCGVFQHLGSLDGAKTASSKAKSFPAEAEIQGRGTIPSVVVCCWQGRLKYCSDQHVGYYLLKGDPKETYRSWLLLSTTNHLVYTGPSANTDSASPAIWAGTETQQTPHRLESLRCSANRFYMCVSDFDCEKLAERSRPLPDGLFCNSAARSLISAGFPFSTKPPLSFHQPPSPHPPETKRQWMI
ncbi:hypothetical protein PAMP_014462 [Pampus punctatissimus]